MHAGPGARLLGPAVDSILARPDDARQGRRRRVVAVHPSAVVALIDRDDQRHDAAVGVLSTRADAPAVPSMTLPAIDGMVGRHDRIGGMDTVLGSFIDGSLLLDCGDVDPPRIRELLRRYRDLGLSFTDAASVACAERHGGALMAFDRRALDRVAFEVAITLVP